MNQNNRDEAADRYEDLFLLFSYRIEKIIAIVLLILLVLAGPLPTASATSFGTIFARQGGAAGRKSIHDRNFRPIARGLKIRGFCNIRSGYGIIFFE
ncbi:hypothetical protein LJK87_07500 [Paenibacillus sp. P25]|nr:hypothetical protein LJK87_07500 [Paenibacillus sp. P25]